VFRYAEETRIKNCMFAAAQNSGVLRGLCIQEKTGHVNQAIAG
jgi:hypothetical protein